ncbi:MULTISPECIES: hypothetical protein [unclassified Streptomyces]|uniref:hypothetical protein n=1 Tax=unclassified Streptomyces TaxID=2593676 RepID=UPI0033F7299E
MRRRLSGRTAGGLLALLLLGAAVPAAVDLAVDLATGHRHADPGCRTVAFMSMTGVAPSCR